MTEPNLTEILLNTEEEQEIVSPTTEPSDPIVRTTPEFWKRLGLEMIADLNAILPAQYSAAFMLGLIYHKNLSVYEIRQYLHYLIKSPKSIGAIPFMLGAFFSNRNIAIEYLPGTTQQVYQDILPGAWKGLVDVFQYISCSYKKKEHVWENPSYAVSLDTVNHSDDNERISVSISADTTDETRRYSIMMPEGTTLQGSISINDFNLSNESDYLMEIQLLHHVIDQNNLKKNPSIPPAPMRHDLACIASLLGLFSGMTYLGLALKSSVIGRTFIGNNWAGWLIDGPIIALYVIVSAMTRIKGSYASLQRRELYSRYCSNREIANILDFYEDFKYKASALPEQQLKEVLDNMHVLKLNEAVHTFYQYVPRKNISFSCLEPKAWPRLACKFIITMLALAAAILFYDIGFDLMSTLTSMLWLCIGLSMLSTIPHEFLYQARLPFIYDEIVNHYYWQKHAAKTKGIDTEQGQTFYALRKTTENSISSFFSWCNLAGPGWNHGQKGALTSIGTPPIAASIIESTAGGVGSFVLNEMSALSLYAPKQEDLPEGMSIQRHSDAVAILEALVVHSTRGKTGSAFYRKAPEVLDNLISSTNTAFEEEKSKYYNASTSMWDKPILDCGTPKNQEPLFEA